MEEPYEVVSDVSQFHFTDNFYLPVYLVRQTYLGYKNEQKTYTEKEAKRLASENLKKYLDDLEEKGIQITEKKCYYRENEEKICGERNDWHFKIHCFLSADKNHRTIERREATDG